MGTKQTATLGVGIIGASRVAPQHALAVQNDERTHLTAIADPDTARAERVAEQYGCEVVADYRDLLKRADVAVVMLGLPNDLHCPVALDALEAGKHVFVEKPMANTLDECDRMIEAAERNDVKIFVGHSQRFFTATVATRDLIRSGRFGEPVMARDTWTKALGADTRPPWFLDRSRGGGMWLMNGAHMIDRVCWVLGSGVTAVKGWVGNPIHHLPADDASIAYLQLKNGLMATLFHAGFQNGNGVDRCGVEIVLTAGMLEFDSYASRLQIARDGVYVPEPVERNNPFVVELRRMIDSLTTGAPLAVPMAWARHIVAVMLAVEESGRLGREVVIPEGDYADPD
ncbi:MAG: Gfo/Idh/MocA family oxidoreductase [Chloroflexi bacterium]|nr:Gfo/Idh/MocA family oxidoreductase [Chloroflexota bacterium]